LPDETFTFRGYYPTVYPELHGPDGGTLIAVPGETVLDFDPGDGLWFSGGEPAPRPPAGENLASDHGEGTGPTAHDASPNPALTGLPSPSSPSEPAKETS
jgi:hypothetical protein